MLARRDRGAWIGLLVGDLILTAVALLVANLVRYRVSLGLVPDLVYVTPGIVLLVVTIWAVVFSIWGAYDKVNLHHSGTEFRTTFFAVTFSLFTLAACFYFLKIQNFSRLLFLYFYIIDVAVVAAFRLAMRNVFTRMRLPGYGRRRVLIVGISPEARQLVDQVQGWADYEVVGFVDDRSESTQAIGVPCLGELADCPDLVAKHSVDEVMITVGRHRANLASLVPALQRHGVRIRFIPDLLDILTVHTAIENLRGIPLVTIREPPISGINAIMKRIVDLCGATACLIICSPLMAVISVLIKLDSPGPVFFIQERAGQYGHRFAMWKFRTMVAGAEKQLPQLVDIQKLEQPVFKLKEDPRVTRIGHWLRRTSLDELPQLINVLRGEMSLVGPRPEQVDLVEHYDAWQAQRLLVKPGITGSMQVSGRGDLSLDERVKLDLAYIENYSLWEDVRLLLKTIPAILSGRGAY